METLRLFSAGYLYLARLLCLVRHLVVVNVVGFFGGF